MTDYVVPKISQILEGDFNEMVVDLENERHMLQARHIMPRGPANEEGNLTSTFGVNEVIYILEGHFEKLLNLCNLEHYLLKVLVLGLLYIN